MSKSKLKLVRAITDLPPSCYRLSTDGRKWKVLCESRHILANWLAGKADPDGTRIFPGIKLMMKAKEWSHGKVCYVLEDLRVIGCIVNEGRRVSVRGTVLRRFDPTPLLDAHAAIKRGEKFTHQDTRATVQDSPAIDEATVQDSEPTVQGSEPQSRIREPQSNVGLDTTVLTDCPNEPSPPPPGKNAEEKERVGAVDFFISQCKTQHTNSGLSIPPTETERRQIQEFEDTYGQKLFRKVVCQWVTNRDFGGLKFVARAFVKEFADKLVEVQRKQAEKEAVEAQMAEDSRRRSVEIDADLANAQEAKKKAERKAQQGHLPTCGLFGECNCPIQESRKEVVV